MTWTPEQITPELLRAELRKLIRYQKEQIRRKNRVLDVAEQRSRPTEGLIYEMEKDQKILAVLESLRRQEAAS